MNNFPPQAQSSRCVCAYKKVNNVHSLKRVLSKFGNGVYPRSPLIPSRISCSPKSGTISRPKTRKLGENRKRTFGSGPQELGLDANQDLKANKLSAAGRTTRTFISCVLGDIFIRRSQNRKSLNFVNKANSDLIPDEFGVSLCSFGAKI